MFYLATNYVSLLALVFNLVVLAVVLSCVGYGLNKLITHVRVSRRERAVKAQALVAGARARAQARAAQRQASA